MPETKKFKPGDRCETCKLLMCQCTRCSQCNARVPRKTVCDKCHMCADHHREYYPKDFPHRGCVFKNGEAVTNSFIINPLHRKIGVEIELNTFGKIADEQGNKHVRWEMVHDGSVAGSALELVTRPMEGDQYIYGMSGIFHKLMDRNHAVVDRSCGYHVHVDAAEFTPLDLRRIMSAFTMVQHDLYGTLVSATRAGDWGQTYCPPLNCDVAKLMAMEDKAQFIDWLHTWLYGTRMPKREEYIKYGEDADGVYKQTLKDIDAQLKHFKNTKYMNRARRWALNLHSWMMRGTLEFRLKEGTLDPGDLIMWPLWCAWFVQKWGQAKDKDIHYYMKKGLTVASATEFMADGVGGMPPYVADWVKEKLNGRE